MAEAVAATGAQADGSSESRSIVFRGSSRNLIPAVAMFTASALSFSMGMTDVFFARATAWTFLIWGLLLLYANLLTMLQTFEVTDDALIIRNPLRPWGAYKSWNWRHLYRLDVVVKRRESRLEDAVMQVYYTAEGEIAMEREDCDYRPQLVGLILERTGLTVDANNPVVELNHLPAGKKGIYTWNR